MLVPHSLAFNPVFGHGVKYRCVQRAVLRSILFYVCKTWSVRVADECMRAVFENDSNRRILHMRRVPLVELWHRLCLTSIPTQLVQRTLRWFGHAARRLDGELIRDHLLSTLPRTKRGQPRSRQTWNSSPDRESSAAHDGERIGCKSLVSSQLTVEPGVPLSSIHASTMPMLVQRRFVHATRRPDS